MVGDGARCFRKDSNCDGVPMKKTKPTKIPRATEKPRRFDDAIRYLRKEARRDVSGSDFLIGKDRSELRHRAAAFSLAADALDEARD